MFFIERLGQAINVTHSQSQLIYSYFFMSNFLDKRDKLIVKILKLMVPNCQPLPVLLDFGGLLRTNQEPGPSTPHLSRIKRYSMYVLYFFQENTRSCCLSGLNENATYRLRYLTLGARLVALFEEIWDCSLGGGSMSLQAGFENSKAPHRF